MSQKQLQRMVVIQKAVEGHLKVSEAAQALNRRERQVQRWKQRFDPEGSSSVLHGNAGRRPAEVLHLPILNKPNVCVFAEVRD